MLKGLKKSIFFVHNFNTMKKHFLFAFALIVLILSACKTERVLQKSSTKPSWVHGLQRNYIIVEGVGANQNEAKNKAFTALRDKIVSSVAVNVSSNSSIQINESTLNQINKYQESTAFETQINSDFLNALRGISLNKVEEFYWERIRYKKEKKEQVHYHIKYPFSDFDLNKLIREWEELDKNLSKELERLQENIRSTNKLSELIGYQAQAERLEDVFNEPRKTRAALLKTEAENMLSRLEIEVEMHQLGELILQARISGKAYDPGEMYTLKSNCIRLLSQKYDQNLQHSILHYDSDFCKSNTEVFTIQLQFGKMLNQKEIELPHSEGTIRAMIIGDVRIIDPKNNTRKRKWTMSLRSLSDIPFEVTRVDMIAERKANALRGLLGKSVPTQIRESLNHKINGKGDYELEFDVFSPGSELEKAIGRLLNDSYVVSGQLFFKTAEGKEQSIHFADVDLRML